ncbi:MAG: hypothetical protein GC191_06660 [Azospirillum sp.]|nr:hypothetical protein [Azospirillum sp.]
MRSDDSDDPCARSRAKSGQDCCRPAVVRAYRELCERGQPDRFAFEAAVTVYRWHHPEVPPARAGDIVSGWVWNGTPH